MNSNFEPLYKEDEKDAFSTWQVDESSDAKEPELDQEAQLQQECEKLREEAKERGYQEGLQQANDELEEKRKTLSHWLNQLLNPIQMLDQALDQELIQTIIWLCKECIGIELSLKPEKLQALIDAVKPELPSLAGNKQLVMNPDDIEWLKSEGDKKGTKDIQELLVADPELARGDFCLKTEDSEIDGCLETRLRNLIATHINLDDS